MNVIYSVKDYVSNVFQQDSVSGAIDVVVVQQADGSLRCSPFHVQFGNVKTDDQQQVTLEVNGLVVDGVRMKLGDAGEAYFVHEVPEPVDETDCVASSMPCRTSLHDSKELLCNGQCVTSETLEPEEEEHAEEVRTQPQRGKTSDLDDRLTWEWSALSSLRPGYETEDILPGMAKSASVYFDAVDIETSVLPTEVEDVDYYNHPYMSLCGHLLDRAATDESAQRIFVDHMVTFDTFRSNPATILTNPNLRFFVNGKVTPYDADMQAYLVSRVLFPYSQHLPVGKLFSSVTSTKSVAENQQLFGSDRSHLKLCRPSLEPLDEMFSNDGDSTQDTASLTSEPYYKKTLKPSQDELREMKLRVGINEILFVLRSHDAGELARVTAKLYMWPHTAKIVIAHIDGAISSSAATGGMFKRRYPAVMHSGAVEFYSKLARNGYHVVYVTRLGLSQVDVLHTLLHNNARENGELALPMGPVLLPPDQWLVNDTIDTQDLRVAALSALRSLFPRDVNPFYAAFGTTETDSVVFTQVGVFSGKVFVVDPRDGSLHHRSLLGYNESYTSLLALMDAMFPHFDILKTRISNSVQHIMPTSIQHTFLFEDEERMLAAHVRTRSLVDEAYNDINFWRIGPGHV